MHTTDNANAGTYNMQLRAVMNSCVEAIVTFDIVVTANPCLTMSITPDTITTPQTYNIH